MTWQRVRVEFESLLEQPPAAREQRLRELDTTDRWLADQLRDLLRQDAAAGAFLERGGAAANSPHVVHAGAGQQLGRYRLLRPLGSGGMGAVWEAEQFEPRRRVAIKLLAGPRTAAARWRFEHEARVLARLQHPAIATFFEVGTDTLGGSDVAWLAMELVDGAVDVLAWAAAQRLSREQRLALFLQLCDAVAYGHRHGVLHRDLKPGNVLVGAEGRLKLIDFGIARAVGETAADDTRHTHAGELVGTLQYMAPEQLRGDVEALGTASDVYALGVLLYHLLCERPPFDFAGHSFADIPRLVLEHEPTPPHVARPELPRDLGWIVLRALAKDPRHRYPTVDALVADLERFRAHEPVQARPAGLGYRARKFVRRNRVAAVVAVALAAGLGVAMWGLWRGAEEARAGERLATLGREEARRGERAALQASELSREVLRVTVDLFKGIDETEGNRDVTVRELLDGAVLDARATADPYVEQTVRLTRGQAYMRVSRPGEARREFERALALQDAVLARVRGTADEAVARGRASIFAAHLGASLAASGDRERGEAMLRDALDDATDVEPAQRLQVLLVLCSYFERTNQDAELVEFATELRQLGERVRDPGASFEAERWLAKANGALQHHDLAKRHAAAAREQAKALYGDDHKLTCSAFATYVTVHHEAGDLDLVAPLYPELIEQVRRVFGPTHKHLLTTLNNHAHLLHVRGDKDGALAALRAVVAVHEGRGGAMTVEHLQASHNLGQVLNMAGRFAEAEPLLRSAADGSTKLLRNTDPDGAKMRFNHGACLAWQKRFADAEPILLREYEALCRLLPAHHDALPKLRRTIADAYRVNGRPDDAAKWSPK